MPSHAEVSAWQPAEPPCVQDGTTALLRRGQAVRATPPREAGRARGSSSLYMATDALQGALHAHDSLRHDWRGAPTGRLQVRYCCLLLRVRGTLTLLALRSSHH